MTPAEFIVLYPSFSTASSTTIQAVLTDVEATISDLWVGDRREEYVGVVTAERLHGDPGGRPARIAPESGAKSPYSDRRARLEAAHACLQYRVG